MKRHLVLVGLPGSGKSTVGRLVADRLGVAFVDLDEEVAMEAGASIASLFAARGEPAFRDLERQAMTNALRAAPSVIAPGGGWAAQSGNVAAVAGQALVVYLALSPATAASRLGGDTTRPLLAGGEPREMLERLLLAREPFYRLAEVEVDAEGGSPDSVAARVAAVARGDGVFS